MEGNNLAGDLEAFIAEHEAELVEFRRDLHAHPEVGYAEHRTTRRIALRLAAAGLRPVILPKGTGLIVDIGGTGREHEAAQRRIVALRADIDALPMGDEKNVPYRSTVPERLPRLRARCAHHRSCSAPACSWPARPLGGCCRAGSG